MRKKTTLVLHKTTSPALRSPRGYTQCLQIKVPLESIEHHLQNRNVFSVFSDSWCHKKTCFQKKSRFFDKLLTKNVNLFIKKITKKNINSQTSIHETHKKIFYGKWTPNIPKILSLSTFYQQTKVLILSWMKIFPQMKYEKEEFHFSFFTLQHKLESNI